MCLCPDLMEKLKTWLMAINAQTLWWCLLDNKKTELSFPCDEDERAAMSNSQTSTAAVIYFQLLDDKKICLFFRGDIHWNPYGFFIVTRGSLLVRTNLMSQPLQLLPWQQKWPAALWTVGKEEFQWEKGLFVCFRPSVQTAFQFSLSYSRAPSKSPLSTLSQLQPWS